MDSQNNVFIEDFVTKKILYNVKEEETNQVFASDNQFYLDLQNWIHFYDLRDGTEPFNKIYYTNQFSWFPLSVMKRSNLIIVNYGDAISIYDERDTEEPLFTFEGQS